MGELAELAASGAIKSVGRPGIRTRVHRRIGVIGGSRYDLNSDVLLSLERKKVGSQKRGVEAKYVEVTQPAIDKLIMGNSSGWPKLLLA